MTAATVVQRQLDCYNAHDLAGFLATYSEEVKVYNFGNPTPLYASYAEFSERYAQLFAEGLIQARSAYRVVLDDKVIDHEIVTKGDWTNMLVVIYEVEDGCITTVTFVR